MKPVFSLFWRESWLIIGSLSQLLSFSNIYSTKFDWHVRLLSLNQFHLGRSNKLDILSCKLMILLQLYVSQCFHGVADNVTKIVTFNSKVYLHYFFNSGRAIRHKDDYALILLLDHRFLRPSVHKKLPGWINSHIQTFERFGPAFLAIRKVNSSFWWRSCSNIGWIALHWIDERQLYSRNCRFASLILIDGHG